MKMTPNRGPDWVNFAGREERGVDVDGKPVVIRVRVEEDPVRENDRTRGHRLRLPGWSADPEAPVHRVEVKDRPVEPWRLARRRQRALAELAAIERAKESANVTDEERKIRAELAALEASS